MMTDTNDNLPTEYNAGPKRHLHALGVIASVYNDFEAGLFTLYGHHLTRRKVPEKVAAKLYFNANEEQRIELLKFIFAEYEKHSDVRAAIDSLCAYFSWCRKSRNTLLHATFIPPLFGFEFGGPEDHMLIAKRFSKKNSDRGYATLRLAELRKIADQIHIGDQCCVNLQWHLMRRDTPQEKWPFGLRSGGPLPLPPKEIELSALSDTPPKSGRPRKALHQKTSRKASSRRNVGKQS